jgi:hypothetical protein
MENHLPDILNLIVTLATIGWIFIIFCIWGFVKSYIDIKKIFEFTVTLTVVGFISLCMTLAIIMPIAYCINYYFHFIELPKSILTYLM